MKRVPESSKGNESLVVESLLGVLVATTGFGFDIFLTFWHRGGGRLCVFVPGGSCDSGFDYGSVVERGSTRLDG